jgi:hypothetical protein
MVGDNLQDAIKGEALESLKLHPGYKIFVNEIIYPIYKDALANLEDHEDVEARAMLKAIKSIVEKIDDSIKLGEQAREEYKQELAKHTSSTP